MMRLPLLRLIFAALLLEAVGCDKHGDVEEFVRWRSFLSQDDAATVVTALPSSFGQQSQANEPRQTTSPADTVHVKTHAMTKQTKPNVSHGLLLRSQAMVHWDTQCPQWLQQYATYHTAATFTYTLNTSSIPPPKLMLHECNAHTLSGCPGLGDRLRGLMETFKLAVHSNRLFLLRWEPSAPLEDVLHPALIDWRVQPHHNIDTTTDSRRYYWHSPLPKPADILSGAFANDSAALLSLTHADQDCKRLLPGPDIGCNDAIPATLRSCVFHALFKPSPNLTAYVDALREQLFGSARERYLAVHLRIGGFEGERKLVRGGLSAGNQSTAEVVALTLSAARDLAAASNISAPVLVLTDNDELRGKLQRGLLPGFVSPGYKAKHAATARGAQHREALLTSFADLLLLAQASCFIGSLSGFTNTAFMWGRHDCFLMVNGDGRGGGGERGFSSIFLIALHCEAATGAAWRRAQQLMGPGPWFRSSEEMQLQEEYVDRIAVRAFSTWCVECRVPLVPLA